MEQPVTFGAQINDWTWEKVAEIVGVPDARLIAEATLAANGIDLDELEQAWENMDLGGVLRASEAIRAAVNE